MNTGSIRNPRVTSTATMRLPENTDIGHANSKSGYVPALTV